MKIIARVYKELTNKNTRNSGYKGYKFSADHTIFNSLPPPPPNQS